MKTCSLYTGCEYQISGTPMGCKYEGRCDFSLPRDTGATWMSYPMPAPELVEEIERLKERVEKLERKVKNG